MPGGEAAMGYYYDPEAEQWYYKGGGQKIDDIKTATGLGPDEVKALQDAYTEDYKGFLGVDPSSDKVLGEGEIDFGGIRSGTIASELAGFTETQDPSMGAMDVSQLIGGDEGTLKDFASSMAYQQFLDRVRGGGYGSLTSEERAAKYMTEEGDVTGFDVYDESTFGFDPMADWTPTKAQWEASPEYKSWEKDSGHFMKDIQSYLPSQMELTKSQFKGYMPEFTGGVKQYSTIASELAREDESGGLSYNPFAKIKEQSRLDTLRKAIESQKSSAYSMSTAGLSRLTEKLRGLGDVSFYG
jgi:hypothetical protein